MQNSCNYGNAGANFHDHAFSLRNLREKITQGDHLQRHLWFWKWRPPGASVLGAARVRPSICRDPCTLGEITERGCSTFIVEAQPIQGYKSHQTAYLR